MEGLGGGFTKPSPNEVGGPLATDLISVTATDKYTAVFKWRKPNPEYILESIQAIGSGSCLIAHEAVEKWGDVNDWHRAIGTGPFILSDFVPGSSATFTKNKNYWGYDERYPQNKLPYVDTMKVLIIPDNATALAGIRTGKIDFVDGIPLSQANAMKKSNPEILQLTLPGASAETLEPRIDKTPFTDIRVRKAIQMAIDLPTIASSFYGGTVSPNPVPLTSPYLKGWGWPYEQWPQDLKDEYAYNPTAAKKLLADAGYPSGFKTNVIADSKGDMDLLQVAKSYLMAVGIDMSITTMDAASWLTYVRTQKKHDQMVNRNGGNTLGLSYEPLRQLQRLTTNYTSNYIILSDATIDGNYAKALAATNVETVKQLLRDDNEYVARQHFVISLLIPINFNLYQPWLKGYSGQARSISGQYTPFFLGFYGARFWVDSAMKQSMGH
jgi:peptide/nickel transport system substrate-binding protein